MRSVARLFGRRAASGHVPQLGLVVLLLLTCLLCFTFRGIATSVSYHLDRAGLATLYVGSGAARPALPSASLAASLPHSVAHLPVGTASQLALSCVAALQLLLGRCDAWWRLCCLASSSSAGVVHTAHAASDSVRGVRSRGGVSLLATSRGKRPAALAKKEVVYRYAPVGASLRVAACRVGRSWISSCPHPLMLPLVVVLVAC
jgi:hypothetical protein